MRVLVALAVGIAALGSAAPAEASDLSFAVGASFAVGGVSFQVAYASPHSGYLPYYYRTAAPLVYPGYACGPHCFRASAHWYHGPACGLVLHHFSLFGFAGPGYYMEGYYPYPYTYGPAPGHYLPFYGRGSSGHLHRSHGYATYGYGYPSHGYGYGYPTHGYGWLGYQSGHGHGGHKHGHWGRGHHGGGHHKGHHRPGSARRTRPGHD
jgi:hypothetical protein